MTTVTSATSSTTSTSSSTTASADTFASTDYQTFLEMLTVQMQNQDPLNPMDSTDYAVQLATFSGVEQQVQTNQLLETIAGSIGQMGISELANWVGMDGKTEEPVYYYGNSVVVETDPASGADSAVLTVKDSYGNTVYSGAVDITNDFVEWDGTQSDGTTAAYGNYSFQLKSYSGSDLIATETAPAYGRIVEARVTDSGTELVMASGATVSSSDITGLRTPSS
ncbi:flagellar hook capping FlgD N-terminal domain-containing protein [Thioclava sp. GXIMD4216]|uniref:Basal-body rod modification protein FlgD n=1 Tax=Thioclava litoralis TaxID=3076557 RepID=A0ABZ1DW54_9RHOB|nr:flagellar hook capping FlgD N-terminal domain-containing protein [Thioclava sp. FTW29]